MQLVQSYRQEEREKTEERREREGDWGEWVWMSGGSEGGWVTAGWVFSLTVYLVLIACGFIKRDLERDS